MRFTKNNRQQILNNNEGFQISTYNSQKNFTENRLYTITGGILKVRTTGKTSWADSRYDQTYTYDADDEVTKRFLRNYKDILKLPE